MIPDRRRVEPVHAPFAERNRAVEPEGLGDVLMDYLRVVRRRWLSVLLLSILGLTTGILTSLWQKPLYRSRMAIEIEDVNGDFLNTRRINPVSEEASSNLLTDVQTQIKILESETLTDRILNKIGPVGDWKKKQAEIPDAEAVAGSGSGERAAKKPPSLKDSETQAALHALTVRQLGQTRLIEVSYTSGDATYAADFLNTLATEYIDSNMEARWKTSEHTGEWLSHQLGDMRAKLERSEAALQQYARQSGLLFAASPIGGADKTNVAEDKLREVQTELAKAQADLAGAQSRYEIATSAAPETLGEVLSDKPLSDMQVKLVDLRRQESELSSIYMPKDEKIKRVEAQITPLLAAIAGQRASILARIHNDYETALRREDLIQKDFNAQSTVVSDQAGKSIQYNILKREVDSNRQLYESMFQELKEANIASAIRASNIRVVDQAKAPSKPYSPKTALNGVLGAMLGLLAGAFYVGLRERLDTTLQEPGDTNSYTSVPELGVIPTGRQEATRHRLGGIGAAGVRSVGSLLQAPDEAKKTRLELIVARQQPSMMADAFRTVVTSILFSGEDGDRPRIMVVTSASPMDGKTTVTCNLGIAMAQTRAKALLIDADLTRPRLDDIFGLRNERGLSTLLQDGALKTTAVESFIQPTAVAGLYVLPSGPTVDAPANLLHSSRLLEILQSVRESFDTVIIDTPPALQMPDARIIGKLADGVIIVTRAGQTTRDAALAVRQRFTEDRIRVLGTVLNDWNPKYTRLARYAYYRDRLYSTNRESR